MIHPSDCTCDWSIGCQLRRSGGVQVNAGAATTKRKGRPGSNAEHNSWEKGIAGEARGRNGAFMPYLDGKGNPIPIKTYSDHRPKFKKLLAEQRAGGATT